MPSMVAIEGRSYSVRDLSTGGIAIRGIDRPLKRGQRLPLTLSLPFEKFSLDIALTADVQHYEKKTQTAGCRFVDLDAGQVSVLNHIVRSYISGEIVNSGDLLHAVGRNNFVTMRRGHDAPEQGIGAKIRTVAFYSVITVAALALAYILIATMAKEIFTLSTPHGTVAGENFTVSAPVSGIFDSTMMPGKSTLAEGATIGRITPSVYGSPPAFIKSPCDCFITKRLTAPGQYAGEGASLLILAPQAGGSHVEALIPQQDVHKIRIGTQATLTIAGNPEEITGTVTDMRTTDKTISLIPGAAPSPVAALIITTDKGALPADLIGRPVHVNLHL